MLRIIILSLAIASLCRTADAALTRIVVRVVGHDAKILGEDAGGAKVTIRDADTGRLLAEGVQNGGSGDTIQIMKDPHKRGDSVFDGKDAAAFVATLDLDRPTRIEVTGAGPLKFPKSIQRVTKTLVVLPGQDIGGDGIVLPVQGPSMELLQPAKVASIAAGDLPLKVHVAMMCNCPIEPGGIWDANKVVVQARLLQGSKVTAQTRLEYAGTLSTFGGTLPKLAPGTHDLQVTAADEKGNAAENRTRIQIR